MTSKPLDISNVLRSSDLRIPCFAVVLALVLMQGCATKTNFVKEGGDYSTDSSQCNVELVNAELNAKDSVKPNELNTPKYLEYKSPFESCMVSKGWTPEKTEFRLNTLKMTW